MKAKTQVWPFLAGTGGYQFWLHFSALVSSFQQLLLLREDTLHQVHGGLHLALIQNINQWFVLPHDVLHQLVSLLVFRQSCGIYCRIAAGFVWGLRGCLEARAGVVSYGTQVRVSLRLCVCLRAWCALILPLACKGTEAWVLSRGPQTVQLGNTQTLWLNSWELTGLQKRTTFLLRDCLWVDNPNWDSLCRRGLVFCHMCHPEIWQTTKASAFKHDFIEYLQVQHYNFYRHTRIYSATSLILPDTEIVQYNLKNWWFLFCNNYNKLIDFSRSLDSTKTRCP